MDQQSRRNASIALHAQSAAVHVDFKFKLWNSEGLLFCLCFVGEKDQLPGVLPDGDPVQWSIERYTWIARGNQTIAAITCDWFSVSMKLATRRYYVFIFVPVVKLSLKETEKVKKKIFLSRTTFMIFYLTWFTSTYSLLSTGCPVVDRWH